MSLRARLLLGLVVLAAAGLVVVGVVTYTQQRSFLLQRVDQQLGAAEPVVDTALDERGYNVPGYGGAGQDGGPPGARGGGGPGGSPSTGGPIGPNRLFLPNGTYGERRDASGRVIGALPFTYGQTAPAPKLPKTIPVNRRFTVGSSGGLQYRVLARYTGNEPGVTIVAIPLADVNQTLHSLLEVVLIVGGGVLIALVVLGWWVIGLGLRPLARMGDTAGAIAAGDLSRRVSPATERTEVGRLGLALNAMLHQIERAFAQRQASEDRLRRFLADASHELRTPLASIRGYAELFRIGAANRPDETEKAMRRIEEEAKRMGVLVEDLLTLARLDEVADVTREPVNLAELARDAADDARAVAPDRRIELHANGPAVVLGDAHQLRQVIANLMRNALVHTPAGTPVELHVSRAAGDGVLEVRDHGPGLPDGPPEAIFERFWRAEPGRGRGKAGAGLGLAIVAGIVAAHGGEARAQNASGGGAQFSVRLPAAPAA